MKMQILQFLTYLALPLTLIGVVDDWFIRPARRLAALPGESHDPAWLRVVYTVLPVAVIGAILRVLLSERLDFSVVLTLVLAISGLIWAVDRWLLAPQRQRRALAAGVAADAVALPVTVDYARSFLPVAALVLVVRAFIFEPFRIPSDSMMPTLLDGDFIVVNKYAYGLRMPVLNRKLLAIGEPQRGDVVVFRYPPDPAVNYIKRLVGLPGDTVSIQDDQLIVNGTPVPVADRGRFNDGCYLNMRLGEEQLGKHLHQTLSCRTSGGLGAPPVASCNRSMDHSYQCDDAQHGDGPDLNDRFDIRVPPGHYLMIGDNRDNSADSRVWGFVPEENLVGRASRIWFNWDLQRSGGPNWRRIGKPID
jgi:signal peptidase I